MENFWPNFEELAPDINHSLNILEEHANSLPQWTNNKVKAIFSETRYKKVGSPSKFSGMGELFGGYNWVEALEAELENKEDANTLFSNKEYKLVVYNDFYRFVVLRLKYNILYPERIILDEDIAKELAKEQSIEINNDAELKELLKAVFNSKKLIAIITHIMSIEDTERRKKQ